MIEAKAYVGLRCLEHVAITIGQNRELAACAAQPFKRCDDIGKGLERLDLRDEPAHFVLSIGYSAPVHHV